MFFLPTPKQFVLFIVNYPLEKLFETKKSLSFYKHFLQPFRENSMNQTNLGELSKDFKGEQ